MLRHDDVALPPLGHQPGDGPSDIGVDASVQLEVVGSLTRHEPSSIAPRESGSDALAYWVRTVLGVALAGAVYGLPFVIIGAIFGLFIATAVGCMLVVPFALATRSLAGRWRHPLAAPAFGGAVGFVSVLPTWDRVSVENAAMFILGPMATTLLGQLGGFLITRDYALYATRIARRRGGSLRFSMRTLLIATTWIAVTVAALRGLGLLEPQSRVAIACWLPWQLALLWFWSFVLRISSK